MDEAKAQGNCLSLFPSAGLVCSLHPFPCPALLPPTWLDSPSSLAGEQEGVGSFQKVSVELQGESWQLEIVSRLLDNRQPNNSGNGGGRGALSRVAKGSSPRPPENLDPPHPVTCVGQGPIRRQKSHQLVERRIKNLLKKKKKNR